MSDKECNFIIAIDGYSSSGKSTLAKQLAKDISYAYLDTGAMYRAVALYAMNQKLVTEEGINVEELIRQLSFIKIHFEFNQEQDRNETFLNGLMVEDRIRDLDVSQLVSATSNIEDVRSFLLERQRSVGKMKSIVIDGRDIGSTVFPDAELKIFVTASPEVRAMRRFDELKSLGKEVSYEEVLANILERDRLDTSRKISPLKVADDAIILDNTTMTKEEQRQWMINQYESRCDEITGG